MWSELLTLDQLGPIAFYKEDQLPFLELYLRADTEDHLSLSSSDVDLGDGEDVSASSTFLREPDPHNMPILSSVRRQLSDPDDLKAMDTRSALGIVPSTFLYSLYASLRALFGRHRVAHAH